MSNLYDQIGGQPTIEKLITAFYQRVLADHELQPFFEDVSIEKLKKMQQAFFQIALGGPIPDVKVSLRQAHAGRGITSHHLASFTNHLVDTLSEIGVEPNDAKRVYERIGTYANEILNETNVDG